MIEAFVYCWTDKATNKLYIGSQKGSTDDGYICSSKYMLKEFYERPDDFSRQIIADDLSHRKKKNFTLIHFIERMKLYAKEKFKTKKYLVNIK